MKVFVAGATGFIGRATCRALTAAGHEVTGLARTPGKARELESDRVRAIVGTLDDPDSYHRAAGRPEAVVHMAATWFSGPETIEQAQSIGARILEWTRGLARLAADSSCRIFVFCGSNVNQTEGGASQAIGYDRILAASQMFLQTEARGVPLAVVLPGWVYGVGSWFPDLVREIRSGVTTHIVGEGSAPLGYVHVDDVGEAFRLAVEKGAAGAIYNVVDEEGLTATRFVEAAARALGVAMPRGVSREQAIRERGEVYAEALTSRVDLDLTRTRRDLGWRLRYPTSREGLPPVLRALETR
jgi:nucleoside-diphosphate-sugar epimerase